MNMYLHDSQVVDQTGLSRGVHCAVSRAHNFRAVENKDQRERFATIGPSKFGTSSINMVSIVLIKHVQRDQA